MRFQHTAARRRLRKIRVDGGKFSFVSTHSRPKAAAHVDSSARFLLLGFNTQPPEGGCTQTLSDIEARIGFNTQPPEGGCLFTVGKALKYEWGFNTQPPEGGCSLKR